MSKTVNDTNENILNAYYKCVGEAHTKNLLQELDDKKFEIEGSEIPDSLKEKLDILIKNNRKEKRKRLKIVQLKKISTRAAIFIAALITTITVITFSVEAVRVTVFNWFLDKNDKYTEIKVDEEPENDISGYYLPSYIPQGYTIDLNQNLETVRIIHLTKDDNIIEFLQAKSSSIFHIDTENAVSSDISINGKAGILIIKDDKVTVFWSNDAMSFSLSGEIDKDEMIKIAENIVKE